MPFKIAILYNEPESSRYSIMGEDKAIAGVLESVGAIQQALTELSHAVTRVSLRPPMSQAKKKLEKLDCQIVFNLFEGFNGSPETEAEIAEILDDTGIPYTGCPPEALSIALDKSKTKSLLKSSGIKTPAYQLLNHGNLRTFNLNYPCIVKPCNEDASHGMDEESVVREYASLETQVEKVSKLFGGSTLVEEFLSGREFNATVIGNKQLTVLPVSEISYSLPESMPKILTFAAKWEKDSIYYEGTKPRCPAEINGNLQSQITEICKNSFKLLKCRGYARVDMRQDSAGQVHVLEVNPNPDISPDSGAALQAKTAGMTYNQFMERIAMLAIGRE